MAKRVLPVLLGVVVVGLGIWYFTQYQGSRGGPLQLYGNVDIREVKPAFRQSGRIEHIYVEDGDRVEKGSLLADIDPVPFQKQVNLSQAKLAVAQAQLADLVVGPRTQEVESAKQEVIRLTATLKNAQDNYYRQKRKKR